MTTKIAVNGWRGQLGSLLWNATEYGSLMGDVETFALSADVRDPIAVDREILSIKPDVVVHCAAIVGTQACDLAGAAAGDVNFGGARNVAEACRAVDARMVYFSTTATYDPDLVAAPRPYTEESPQNPRTRYGKTKHWGEEVVKATLPRSSLSIRPCFVHGGPRDRVSSVANLVRAARSGHPYILQLDPANRKDWIHASDFAAAAMRLISLPADDPAWGGEAWNIAHGTPRPFADVVSILKSMQLWPAYVVERPQDDYMGHHEVSNAKFRARFPDWAPRYDLESGIMATVMENS